MNCSAVNLNPAQAGFCDLVVANLFAGEKEWFSSFLPSPLSLPILGEKGEIKGGK
jgi:hypothetical protein